MRGSSVGEFLVGGGEGGLLRYRSRHIQAVVERSAVPIGDLKGPLSQLR